VSSIKGGWDTAVSAAGGETWFQDEALTYDAIGNPTSVLDQTTGVRECFRYDSWQRLTRAWTKGPSLACEPGTSTPSASGTNGYHETYSIDLIGRMTTWTTTDLASSTTSTRNFTYGDAAHPDAPTSNGTMTLTYDANGSVATRAGTGLSWDALHRLIGITGTQTNVYGNDGLRLLRTDTTAATVTLFLPGQQVTGPVGAGAVTTAIRSYQLGATTIATRTGPGATGVYWNCGQRQNSTSCSTPINTGSAPTTPIARYTPYGTPRTGSPTLPGTERGFVGQITDTTGLNQLGQRVYDPAFGVFLSVDPLVSKTGTPYLYANGNPTTFTDPSGLCATTRGMHSYDDGKGPCGGGGSHGSCAGTCRPAPELHGNEDLLKAAANRARVDVTLLAAIYAHERISYDGGAKDMAADTFMIEAMDLRAAVTGDASPSIGYTQIDLPTFTNTMRNHSELVPPGLAAGDPNSDLNMKLAWIHLDEDEEFAINVAAFVISDKRASIVDRLVSSGMKVNGNEVIPTNHSSISLDRLVAGSYSISVENMVSAFEGGTYDSSIGDRYVYSRYASNRLADANVLSRTSLL
jgi:RHS repeat-associated protein